MTLFRAKDGIDAVKVNRAVRKEIKDSAPGTLTWQQRKYEAIEQKIRRLEKRMVDMEGRQDKQEEWNTSCELTVREQGSAISAPSVPLVKCQECRGQYPNYPAYWPGGFHGSTDPVCCYCKPERDYL